MGALSPPPKRSDSVVARTIRGSRAHAIRYCLAEPGVSLSDVDHVAFYDKPFLKFERLLETYLAFAPRGYRSFARALIKIQMIVFEKVELFVNDFGYAPAVFV